jgi:enamine deaminase RidA (YjgF/YER057c/UK114 family)
MDNIKTVLERNGSSFDSVFNCTVMLADLADCAMPKGELAARSNCS